MWTPHRNAAEMMPNPASEMFVLFTLMTLFFILGSFALWMWLLWRRSVNPPPHVKLLMELQEEEDAAAAVTPVGIEEEDKPAHPWERSADWWKKSE